MSSSTATATALKTKAEAPAKRKPNLLRRYRPWGLGVVVIAGAAYLAQPLVFGPSVPAYRVARRDLTATVVASGRVLTPYRANIGSQLTGVVEQVPVEEGQSVRKGQPLVVLQSRDLEAAVQQADAQVAQARAKLVQMQTVALPAAKANRVQTTAALANAQLTYDRMKTLIQQNSVAQAQVDTAERDLQAARGQDQAAAIQVRTYSSDGADHKVAETDLAVSEASLASAQAKLGYAVIRAPWDGVLISRNVERGDVVAPGMVLMALSPAARTEILIDVDEKNLAHLAVGQSAVVSADAFPDRHFPARVTYVNPGVDAATAAVEVKLLVQDPPAFLRQDMTVSVDILSASRRGATVVPADAVRKTPDGQTYVLIAEHGRAQRRPVRIGVSAGGAAEVLQGLEPGDVVLPSTDKVSPGQRVRPHA
jgi:HlyD family secretion protein